VRLKPGKPLYCGRLGERWVFGLPGNPLSTVATYLLFVEPLLRRLAGEAGAVAPLRDARLGAPSRIDGDRTVLATAHLRAGEDGELVATPTAEQGSHLTKALAEADAFVVLPHAQPDLPAGAPVRVLELHRC
jgi:molybdopterin molybdotransferase